MTEKNRQSPVTSRGQDERSEVKEVAAKEVKFDNGILFAGEASAATK